MSKDDQEPKSKRFDTDLKVFALLSPPILLQSSTLFLLLKKSPWGQLFHSHKESVVAGVGLAITKSLTGISLIIYLSRQNGSPTRFAPGSSSSQFQFLFSLSSDSLYCCSSFVLHRSAIAILYLTLLFLVERIPRKIIILRAANLMLNFCLVTTLIATS